jgi:hypothetical protein
MQEGMHISFARGCTRARSIVPIKERALSLARDNGTRVRLASR